MLLVLQRSDANDARTIGVLMAGAAFECYTLEDRLRPRDATKVPGKTAIPAGLYRVVVSWSPRFGRELPMLEHVPGFEGIRIHAGNDAEDTDGCILVGRRREADAILESRAALEALVPKIQAAEREDAGCWIDVRNPWVEAIRLSAETQ